MWMGFDVLCARKGRSGREGSWNLGKIAEVVRLTCKIGIKLKTEWSVKSIKSNKFV